MIALLALYISLPKAILPFQCSFFSGFSCLDIAYFNTGNGGSQLVVLGSDEQVGTFNFSSFNAIVDFTPSTGGFCTPDEVVAGQKFYCVANFSGQAAAQAYSGTFSASAGYCTGGVSGLGSYNCKASGNYTFGGAFRTDGQSSKPPFLVTYLIAYLPPTQADVLDVNWSGYLYQQLPLGISYPSGTGHAVLYRPLVAGPGNTAYIFNSIYGCGVTTEGAFFVVTSSCTITATYRRISYGDCPNVPDAGGANLLMISVAYCSLSGYDMAGDNINGGTIYAANMQGTDLNGANLNDANMSYTDLQGAALAGVNFNNADLEGVDMQNASTIDGSNFNGANLEYADMQNSNAIGDNFRGANLQFADLQNADLSGDNFQNADLAYADLEGADTSGANFGGTYTVGCLGCP